MVRHIVYSDQLVFPRRDDPSDVFLQFIVMRRLNQRLPAFDCEDDVDVNLAVGVGHKGKMSLLTELGNSICLAILQRCRPWPGLGNSITKAKMQRTIRRTALAVASNSS